MGLFPLVVNKLFRDSPLKGLFPLVANKEFAMLPVKKKPGNIGDSPGVTVPV